MSDHDDEILVNDGGPVLGDKNRGLEQEMTPEEIDAYFAENQDKLPVGVSEPAFDAGTALVNYVKQFARRGGAMSAQYAFGMLTEVHQAQGKSMREQRSAIGRLNGRVAELGGRLIDLTRAQKLKPWRLWLIKKLSSGLIDLKHDSQKDEEYNDERK